MPTFPLSHVEDAHKLVADGEVDLFQLTPAGGTATFYFKADNNVTWLNNLYNGIPLGFTEAKMSSEGAQGPSRLVIGQENIDLTLFKPLTYDGTLDGATVVRHHLLLTDLLANNNIKTTFFYRVRRVESYSRTKISLALATASDAMGFTIPHRQYLPPAFPSVAIG